MKHITQKIYKEIVKLDSAQGRKKSEYYVIEGTRCCQEAVDRLKASEIVALIHTPGCEFEYSNIHEDKIYTATDKELAKLTKTQNPQGVMVLARKQIFKDLSFSDDFLLVLDRIQDPGNIGTILRTAIAVGITEIALIKGCVDPFNPKAIRAGMGSQFSLKFQQYDNIESISQINNLADRKIWLTTPHEGVSCYDPSFKLKDSILVFGEEANGILDFSIGEKTMIPTLSDIESLNVAQAATVYLFEGLRQKLIT